MQKYRNNWRTSTLTNLLAGGTAVSVSPADAVILGALTGGDFYRVTMETEDAQTREIVRITGVDTVTGELTITRAQEGTTALGWPIGSLIDMRVTRETLEDLQVVEFDPDTILTDGTSVLIDENGNVLIGV